jgi:hypothetical protein
VDFDCSSEAGDPLELGNEMGMHPPSLVLMGYVINNNVFYMDFARSNGCMVSIY